MHSCLGPELNPLPGTCLWPGTVFVPASVYNMYLGSECDGEIHYLNCIRQPIRSNEIGASLQLDDLCSYIVVLMVTSIFHGGVCASVICGIFFIFRNSGYDCICNLYL